MVPTGASVTHRSCGICLRPDALTLARCSGLPRPCGLRPVAPPPDFLNCLLDHQNSQNRAPFGAVRNCRHTICAAQLLHAAQPVTINRNHRSRSPEYAIITSQLPIEHWHAWIGDATIADAILDRVMHKNHRFNLMGESLRGNKKSATSVKGEIGQKAASTQQ